MFFSSNLSRFGPRMTVSLHAGYEALFTQKSREAMGAAGKVDGCATFWKAQKYRVAEQRELRFNDLAYAEARSRRPAAPSRHRRDASPSHDDVGGFVSDFERVSHRRARTG